MIPPLECWNGGRVQWDRVDAPQFVFAFPPERPDMVAFPLLSGRICEVLTRSDWILNMGGQLFDIPDLPVEEMGRLARSIRDAVRCVPVTVPYPLGDPSAGYIAIPLVLWANAASGHADVYSPLTGFVQGQQLLDPQAQLSGDAPRVSADDLEIDISSGGTLPSDSAQSLLKSLAAMAGDSGRIDEFLSGGARAPSTVIRAQTTPSRTPATHRPSSRKARRDGQAARTRTPTQTPIRRRS